MDIRRIIIIIMIATLTCGPIARAEDMPVFDKAAYIS